MRIKTGGRSDLPSWQSRQLGRRERHGVQVAPGVAETQNLRGDVRVAATRIAIRLLCVNLDVAGDDWRSVGGRRGCASGADLPVAVIGIVASCNRCACGA